MVQPVVIARRVPLGHRADALGESFDEVQSNPKFCSMQTRNAMRPQRGHVMNPNKVNSLYPLQTCTVCRETKPTTRENFGTKESGKPRAQCRDCHRRRINEYAAKNRELGRERARARKASLERVGVVNEHLKYRELLLKEQCEKCYFCKAIITLKTIEIDHLIPISKGGSNDYVNLAGCCSSCNKAKTNKTELEFILWRKHRLKNYE